MKGRIIRISDGMFESDKADVLRDAMKDSYDKLAPGIRSPDGNRGYFAGFDIENNAMVNVSAWSTLEEAKQMTRFRPMLDLAEEFNRLGVRFERPILNFEQIWVIEPELA